MQPSAHKVFVDKCGWHTASLTYFPVLTLNFVSRGHCLSINNDKVKEERRWGQEWGKRKGRREGRGSREGEREGRNKEEENWDWNPGRDKAADLLNRKKGIKHVQLYPCAQNHLKIEIAPAEENPFKTGSLQRKKAKISRPVWSELADTIAQSQLRPLWGLLAAQGTRVIPAPPSSLCTGAVSHSDRDSYLPLALVPLKTSKSVFTFARKWLE